MIRGGPSGSPIVAPSLATFSSFFARHKICVRAEFNVGEHCARALFIPAMKKEEDVTNNTGLLVCPLSGPFKANKKRVMLHSLVMHLGCQGAICRAAGVTLKPCRSRCFCSLTLLNLSLSRTHSPTFCPNFRNLSLSAFHTRFFKKRVNVRGWGGSSSDAFTCVLVLGHPSLRCFCPQLSLYAVPGGLLTPIKLISPIPFS